MWANKEATDPSAFFFDSPAKSAIEQGNAFHGHQGKFPHGNSLLIGCDDGGDPASREVTQCGAYARQKLNRVVSIQVADSRGHPDQGVVTIEDNQPRKHR
jgi:hypothetical protein